MSKTKHRAIVVVTVMVAALAATQGAFATPDADGPRHTTWYAGINPLALVVPHAGYAGFIVQVLTAEEVGCSLAGGVFLTRNHALETRLDLGLPNALTFQTLGSIAYKLFPVPLGTRGGPFVGPELRVGHLWYTGANVGYLNIVPCMDVGWYLSIGRLYLNLRVVQSLAAATFCSDPAIAPAVAWVFSPSPGQAAVLPVLSLDVGFQF